MKSDQLESHTAVATTGPAAFIGVGRVAAAAALLALLAGGSLVAATGPLLANAPGDDLWRPLRDSPALFWWGAVGLSLISLFDLFTIPALHLRLHAGHPRLILVATMTAAVGDLLGVIGRLIQASEVPAATAAPAGLPVLAILEQNLNTAGFALVSVSFASFGIAMLRGFSGWLGWVGILAGLSTALGQLPGLEAVFYVANLAFVAWYLGLVITLRRPRGRSSSYAVESAATVPGSPQWPASGSG